MKIQFKPSVCKWSAESAISNIIAEHDSHTDINLTQKLKWHIVEGFPFGCIGIIVWQTIGSTAKKTAEEVSQINHTNNDATLSTANAIQENERTRETFCFKKSAAIQTGQSELTSAIHCLLLRSIIWKLTSACWLKSSQAQNKKQVSGNDSEVIWSIFNWQNTNS